MVQSKFMNNMKEYGKNKLLMRSMCVPQRELTRTRLSVLRCAFCAESAHVHVLLLEVLFFSDSLYFSIFIFFPLLPHSILYSTFFSSSSSRHLLSHICSVLLWLTTLKLKPQKTKKQACEGEKIDLNYGL